MANRNRGWKLLGLAGLAGVAATGAVLARDERRRRAYSADDVRTRLHDRHMELAAVPDPEPVPAEVDSRLGVLLRRLSRRRPGARAPRP